jgi:SAM-dependent methyltransferase
MSSDGVHEEDLAWWAELAPKIDWTWARTFAKSFPHSYVVKGKNISDEDYERLFHLIQRFGVPRKFFQRINIELVMPDVTIEHGPKRDRQTAVGVKFWPMTDQISESIIINMAPADASYGDQDAPDTHSEHTSIYDVLTPEYDERYADPECEAENRAAWKAVMFPTLGEAPYDLLDLGAGTGLALDLKMVKDKPDLYRAVDPSQAMLNRLLFKHQWVKDVHPVTAEEYLTEADDSRRFDKVISLFGSPSYMDPETIRTIPYLSRRLVCLMHYVEGYLPDYHTDETAPPYAEESRKAALGLLDDHRGRSFTLGKFQVVVLLKEGFSWE